MYQLIESIAVKDGDILHLEWNEARFAKAYKELYGKQPPMPLLHGNDITIPQQGYFKLRIAYNETKKEFTLDAYTIKNIQSLKVVEDNTIDYHLKYADRSALNTLFAWRNDCDDILIVKNNKVSDTFAGNIVFYDGDKWWTPTSPLLEGTCRERLLESQQIFERHITLEDLKSFTSFQVINAMRPFDKHSYTNIQNIVQ